MARRPGPEVRVWAVQDRRADGKARPWVVRWVVGGARHSQAFTHRAQADDFHARLRIAAADGERFDAATGKPASWLREDATVAQFAYRWYREQWPTWAAGSRRASAESLERWVPILVRKGAPKPPSDLRAHTTKWLAGDGEMPSHLSRWSMPIADLDQTAAERIWRALGLTLDGKRPLAPTTAARMRQSFKTVVAAASVAGHCDAVVWPKLSRRAKERIAVRCDPALVPTLPQVKSLIEALGPRHTKGRTARDYRPLFGLMYYCGLRPGEAFAIHADDLILPETGWGRVTVSRTARVDDDEMWLDGDAEFGPVKAGAVGREIPVPPQCVELLREVAAGGGYMFGGVSRRAVSRAWTRAKVASLPAGELRQMTPYYMRHAHATHGLRAGVSIGVLADRLGHSREMLTTIYDGWLDGDDERANRLLEAVFAE